MDLPSATENLKRMQKKGKEIGCPVYAVSAATHEGFDSLFDRVAKDLEELPPILHYHEEELEEDVHSEEFEIIRNGSVFDIVGTGIEHLIESVNFNDQESLNWFHRMLRKLGVIDALREKGATEGSTVRIAEMEFDFIE